MNLRQPGFTYNFVDLLLKRKSECKTRVWKYIYQTKLDKACFQHDMAYGDILRITKTADKMLR